MKIKKKRILGILISFALMLGLMQGMTMTAWADDHACTDNHNVDGDWVGINKLTNIAKGGNFNYYLTEDITMTQDWKLYGSGSSNLLTVNLCLNGHTIKIPDGFNYKIYLQKYVVLNLYDNDSADGKILGASSHFGPCIQLGYDQNNYNATLNMYGGTITGHENTAGGTSGSTVHVKYKSNFNMYGGKITGNSGKYGGGVVIEGTDSTFTMSGGEISNNTSTSTGAGLVTTADAGITVRITGGRITGNVGAGIDRGSWAVPLEMGGDPYVYGNTDLSGAAKDVVVSSVFKPFSIVGQLEEGAKIGLYQASPTTSGTAITSGYSTYNGSTNPSQYFVSNKSDAVVTLKNNEGYLVKHTHSFSYAVDSTNKNQINGWCTTGWCSYTSVNPATMIISAPTDLTYDGTEKAATLNDYNTTVFSGTYNISYYTATKNDDTYTKSSTTALGSAPVNAGHYLAEVTAGSSTAYVGFTIEKQAAEAPSTVTATATDTGITFTAPVSDSTYTYEYSVDNGITWQESTTFTDLQPGTLYTLKARVKETDSVMASDSASDQLVTALTVSVSGSAATNNALTASATGKEGASFTYQWYKGDSADFEPDVSNEISGATESSYTLTAEDEAKYVKVMVIQIVDNDIPKAFGISEAMGPVINHTHIFTYDESGTDIIATCTENGCTLNDGQDNPAVKLTIVAPELTTYGGTGNAWATLTGLEAFNTATALSVTADSIRYFNAAKSEDVYTKSSDTPLTQAPTGAGDYVAEITVQEKTASVGYSIAKASPGSPEVYMTGYTYGNAVPAPSTGDYSGGGAVTYYYNSANSTTGGTEWTDIESTTLYAATYYMYAVIAATDNYDSYTTATKEFIVSKANQETPEAPTKAQATVDSITLTSTDGYEYKCGNGDWQTSATFTGLNMNTEYSFYQRVAGDDNHYPSDSSSEAKISTLNHTHEWSYSSNGAEVIATCGNTDGLHGNDTTSTFTIVAPSLSVYGGTESSAATFDGLEDFNSATGLNISEPVVSYYNATKNEDVYTKSGDALTSAPTGVGNYVAEITVNLGGNDVVASIGYTISKAQAESLSEAQALEGLNLSYTGETVSSKDGFEVSLDGIAVADTTASLTEIFDGTGVPRVYVRRASNDNTEAGAWVAVTLTARPNTPNLSCTNATNSSTADGEISGTDTDMEYKLKNSDNDWTTASNGKTTGLSQGTYLVRVKATVSSPAGRITEVTLGSKEIILSSGQKPTEKTGLVYDGSEQELINAPADALPEGAVGIQYVIGNNDSTAPASGWGTTIPAASEAGTYYVWYKVISDDAHNDTEPEVLAVTINELVNVTFNSNGGSGSMEDQEVIKGAETQLNTNTFTREGYVFKGWNTEADGSGTPYGDKETISTDIPITLYAQWEKYYDHNHLPLKEVKAAEPGCETEGNKHYYECEICGKVYEDPMGQVELTKAEVTIKPTGHKWDNGEVTKEATYYETGIRTYTCQNDPSHTREEEIPSKEYRESDTDNSDGSTGSSAGGSGNLSNKSSSSTNAEIQAKIDQINTGASVAIPENHQVESGLPASDVGGNWGNNADIWTYTKSDGSFAVGEWMNLDYNGLRYWYYFDNNGIMQTNWFDYNNERYYLVPQMDGWRGRMATGWKNIENKWYYFETVPGSLQGRLYRSTVTPDGHTVNADGSWNGVGTTPVAQE